MHIYYLHLCKQMVIYILRTKDHHIPYGSPSAALPFHLFEKKRKERNTWNPECCCDSDWLFCKRERGFSLELWSHCGSLFYTSQTALPSAGLSTAHCGQPLNLFLTFHTVRSKETNFIHKNWDNHLQFEGFVTLLLALFFMTSVMHT